MQDSIAQQIYHEAEALVQAVRTSGANISENLALSLNRFIKWPFSSGAVCVTDSMGHVVNLSTAVYTVSEGYSGATPANVNSDSIACAICEFQFLGYEELHSGYEEISTFKRLKRTPSPEIGFPVNSSPLGVVFAIDSELPIENIAKHLMLLNKNYPSTEWPDLVVVLTKGTVNYAFQLLGESIKGDFLLPHSNQAFPVSPFYVHVFSRGLGLFSLNKMFSLIFMHLMTFSPGMKLPLPDAVMEGSSSLGLPIGAYQYNLKDQLVPARNILWEQGVIGPLPFRIEDKKGNLLSHIQYIPWQDGGVVKLSGKLPLDRIILLLGSVAENAKIFKQPNGAISSVLPINENDFSKMLMRFETQSNMKVMQERPKWTISKFADEGTASPFMNRLLFGILEFRNNIFHDEELRKQFDMSYQFVFDTLMTARTLSDEIKQVLAEHDSRMSQGQIASVKGGIIHIEENIDKKLQKQLDGFLNTTVRVVKDAMQPLLSHFGIDIGFLYSKQTSFEKSYQFLQKISQN